MSKKHKKHDHEEHIDETWLIPYADLLTLLLALFIILFASSQTDTKKYNSIMKAMNQAFTGGEASFQVSHLIPLSNEPNPGKGAADDGDNKDANQSAQQQTSALPTAKPTPTPNTKAEAEAALKEQKDFAELKKKLDQYIKSNNLMGQLDTKLTADKLVITISDAALFDSGSAIIKDNSSKLAQSIGTMLSQYPGYQIEVAGHTDNVPISNAEFDTNWDLSAKRALNFMKVLLKGTTVDPALFHSVGYGEYRPVASNDTDEGRAQNRRVEVNILHNLK